MTSLAPGVVCGPCTKHPNFMPQDWKETDSIDLGCPCCLVGHQDPRVKAGTSVTCTDIATGEKETKVIRDDWMLITDGDAFVTYSTRYQNGTVVLTIKREKADGTG